MNQINLTGMKQIKYRQQLNEIIDISLPVAEVGVAEGLFSREILRWGIPRLYLIDSWKKLDQDGDGGNDQEWHDKNLLNVQNIKDSRVIILHGLSLEMSDRVPDKSLGLVYLDACHLFQCVLQDLEAWLPKLVRGGIMAGHDYLNPNYGVNQAVTQFCEGKYRVHTIEGNKWTDQRINSSEEVGVNDAGFWFQV